MSLKFEIRGFKEIEAALNRKVEAVTKGIDQEMTATTLTINERQVQATPVDHGVLKGNNEFDVSKPLNKVLRNRTDYAGYVEFGTGGLVTIPEGLQDQAYPWKGQGLRQVNMRAQPFFFWPAFQEWAKMIERIKKKLAEK